MRIRTRKIQMLGASGHYTVRQIDDFEYVNPIEHIASIFISSSMSFDRDILLMKGLQVPEVLMERFLFKEAVKEWHKENKRYQSIEVPKALYTLLEAKSKKDQVNALNGLSLTADELISFIFMAFEKYGYRYSQYTAHHHHKGLDESQLPKLIHIEDDGSVTSIGKTNLTKGQQKQAVEHRKVTVSKFIDLGSSWHCFFLTFQSLKGKESYKDGQPHLHYISDKWNIPRNDVVSQLTNKDYSLPSLPHIDFHTHRNPRKLRK